jgi:hypothetical protein
MGCKFRVASWHVFKLKIPIWVWASCNGRCWYALMPFGIFKVILYILLHFGYLVHFVIFRYIFWLFCTFCCILVYFMVIWYFSPFLVCRTKKNLATLCKILATMKWRRERFDNFINKIIVLANTTGHCCRVFPKMEDSMFFRARMTRWVYENIA